MLDEPGVAVCGRGSDLASFAWQPRLAEKRCDGDRSAGRRPLLAWFSVDAMEDGLCFIAVVADGMPSPALPSAERVEAAVGDDLGGLGVERCRS